MWPMRTLMNLALLAALPVLVLPLVVTCSAIGATDAPKLLVHLEDLNTGKKVCRLYDPPPCDRIRNTGELYPRKYHAFLILYDMDELSAALGIQFGVRYDAQVGSGVDIYEWLPCSYFEYRSPEWPNSGTGNTIYWETRDIRSSTTSGADLIGYFYLAAYSPDCLTITGHLGREAVVISEESNGVVRNVDAAVSQACFSSNYSPLNMDPCSTLNQPEANGSLESLSSTAFSKTTTALSTKRNLASQSMSISYSIARESSIHINIYDVSGRQVFSYSESGVAAGLHEIQWDLRSKGGGRIPSGLYFCRLTTDETNLTSRMLVLP